MTTVRVAAAQATYVLMNRDATIDRVAELVAAAAAQGA
jgi:nitrilase